MSLVELFSSIKDPRRSQGKRVSLAQIFSILVLSYLCGSKGYRGSWRFAKVHSVMLTEYLSLKHGIPSYVTIRDVLMRVDKSELISQFNLWALDYVELTEGDWLSGDGKSLCSTVSDAHGDAQDFENVVSLFAHQSGLVAMVQSYRNQKKSEISILVSMIESLGKMGLIIRMDALHTQKKQ